MKSKFLSVIRFILGWPLSLFALFFLFKFFTPQLGQIRNNFIHANVMALVIAFIFLELYFLFRVILWKKILSYWGHEVPFAQTSWYWSLAELNRYIPGNIWSVLGRGTTFAQFGISQKKLLLAWGVESLLVLWGSLTVSYMGLTLLFFHSLPSFQLRTLLFYITVVGIVFLSFVWIFQSQLQRFKVLPGKLTGFSFPPYAAFKLLVLSSLAFFFFGVGTYFSITAVWPIPSNQLFQFAGIFSAAFLLGYVSIITPMGLGVRELVMSAGLLGFVTKGSIGFATIFVRALLIMGELLYLALSFFLHKAKKLTQSRFAVQVKHYSYEYAVGAGICIYTLYFTIASFLRYTNFFTGRFDLGNMDQTVWNTIHGRIFQLTDPNGTNIMSRLGTHADFLLALLSPFYLLWQDPRILLFLQTIVLALGAAFVFLIAKKVLGNRLLACIISFAYLLSPGVQNSNLYDFHAVTFATTFFLAAWYFLQNKKYLWTVIFLILAGLTKEEAWIVVGFFGIYFAFFHKKRVLGVLLSIFSFLMFYLLICKLIPLARGGQHFALSYYSDFGNTPTSVIKNILFSPGTILKILFEKSRLLYVFNLLMPVGFLSLFSPLILIFAFPDFGINILSSNSQLREMYYQYTAVITPFLIIALLYGIQQVKRFFPRLSNTFFYWYVAIFALLGSYFLGPLPGAIHQNVDMFIHPQPNKAIIEDFLQDIPKRLSVAATNNLGSHLSHRQLIYTIPVGIDKADIIVFLLNDPYAQPSLKAQKEMVQEMKHDRKYHQLFEIGDFVAFEKVHDPRITY